MKKVRARLDQILVERGLAESREQAQRLIMAGSVLVNGQPAMKPAARADDQTLIEVRARPRFVSRGGEKLAAALDSFAVNPQGWVCADVGASTGGFTDCLLQRGAARVYAIDVGYGQIAWGLRQDSRVVLMERTNARYLTALAEPVTLVAVDVSFISVRHLLPVLTRWLDARGQIVILVKPQFEAGRSQVSRGGVVRDPAVHASVLHAVVGYAREAGLHAAGLVPSPITGPAGNLEFLLWATVQAPSWPFDAAEAIEEAVEAAQRRKNLPAPADDPDQGPAS